MNQYEFEIQRMMLEDSRKREKNKNPAVSLISAIWGCTVGLTALSIPLAGIFRDNSVLLLPFIGVIGSTISTLFIWKNRSQDSTSSLPQPPLTPQQLDEITELRAALVDLRSHLNHLEQSIDEKHLKNQIENVSNKQLE